MRKRNMKKNTKIKDRMISFTVIGGGHVLTKYLLPIIAKTNKFKINRIITRSNSKDFREYLLSSPNYRKYKKIDVDQINHQQTTGSPKDIVKKVKSKKVQNEAILLMTPPQTIFKTLKPLLTKTSKPIYVEKPAVTNLSELKELKELIKKYRRRMYFAEQYYYGRAPIFLKSFKKYKSKLGKIKAMELHLEEGQKYFDTVQSWSARVLNDGQRYFDFTQSWFADVSPELDLDVHLLSTMFSLVGSRAKYKILEAYNPKSYLLNYGSQAKLLLTDKKGNKVNVFIKCGKKPGRNIRYFKVKCKNGELLQRYSSGTSQDPVTLKIGKTRAKRVAKYPNTYIYFETQLLEFLSWLVKRRQDDSPLKALECALQIREQRLATQQKNATVRKNKFVAMIPARIGSKRIIKKNIREMAGKPMIYYAIKASADAQVFDDIYVNSESPIIGAIGQKLGVKFYKRNPNLAKDHVKNEEFVYDFMQNIQTDYLFMVNPTSPLINPKEIRSFVEKMIEDDVDTMFSVSELRAQIFFNGVPLNFNIDEAHISSQEITPAHSIQWAITGWKTRTFLKNYRKKGFATYSGKIGTFILSDHASVDVDYEDDFIFAELILKMKQKEEEKALKGIVEQYHRKMTRVLESIDLKKIREIIKLLVDAHKRGAQIFVMGNGGSAATASHFTADINQNITRNVKGRINAQCLNDNVPRITSIANDLGYENIYKEQLINVLHPKDIVIVITGSGNSENILEAIKYAGDQGAYTIGMLGFDGGKAIKLVDTAILVKSFDYTIVENSHMFICDLITNYFQDRLKKE